MSVKPLLADPVFPGLGVASDPEIMRGVFADYLRPLRGGTYRVTDCRLSRVRYRRGTRCVLQYSPRLADSDPVLDVANVFAHLKSMPFRFPLTLEDSWSTAAQAFAEEYFSHVPRSWRRRLPIHYAGAVMKFSVGFFARQEPDWPGTIATLLEEAKASLAGRVW